MQSAVARESRRREGEGTSRSMEEEEEEEEDAEDGSGGIGQAGRGWLDGLYTRCHSGLAQGMVAAKDAVFPSRVIQRRLTSAQRRLREAEEELEVIRTREAGERKRRRGRHSTSLQRDASAITHSPPPPPPPPPSLASEPRRASVRLKSRRIRQVSSSGRFVVSLADMKAVRRKSERRRRSVHRRSQWLSPDHRSTKFKHSPRRVNTQRTPRAGVDQENGEGPTPMITRALRRQSQATNPLSPVNSLSPSSSPASKALPSPPPPSEQTFSPPSPPPNSVQTISPSSPLSFMSIREI